MTAIITSSAGPLCVSHPDSWRSRAEHNDTGTFIRLYPQASQADAVTATVLISVVNKAASTEQVLHELVMGLRAERGVYDVTIDFTPGENTGGAAYRLAISETGEPGEGDLRGMAVIRKYNSVFTRFDFVAPEAYYQAHYKEALIMSSAVYYAE